MVNYALGVRLVLCLCLSVLLIKLACERQQILWYRKEVPELEDLDTCPDLAVTAEPRLDWPTWLPFAKKLSKEVSEADQAEGFDVLFYGDSITEQWRGSSVGVLYPSLKQTHADFNTHFNRNYSSEVLAIAGDQIGHLWWRLQNGNIPIKKQPKAAVMLIGTNDLTADDCLQSSEASMAAVVGIISRAREVLGLLRSRLPDTDILLLGLLPRDAHVLSGPPVYEWPNRMSDAIALANFQYEEMAAADSKVHFLDCGAPLILPGGGLDASLLPDALHPNAQGMELVAQCIQPLLDTIVLTPSPSNASLLAATGN